MKIRLGNSEILVRDARSEELDEIAGLLVAAYDEFKEKIPYETWEWYKNDIMDVRGRLPDSELIVAEMENRIVGAVTLFPNGFDHGWPEGWAGVRLLGVHPEARRYGIGRALMEECIRRCRERGIRTLGLHTTWLMKAAHRLYERMGFKRVEKLDFHPDEQNPEHTVYAYRYDL